jgi:hypothetical protein
MATATVNGDPAVQAARAKLDRLKAELAKKRKTLAAWEKEAANMVPEGEAVQRAARDVLEGKAPTFPVPPSFDFETLRKEILAFEAALPLAEHEVNSAEWDAAHAILDELKKGYAAYAKRIGGLLVQLAAAVGEANEYQARVAWDVQKRAGALPGLGLYRDDEDLTAGLLAEWWDGHGDAAGVPMPDLKKLHRECESSNSMHLAASQAQAAYRR